MKTSTVIKIISVNIKIWFLKLFRLEKKILPYKVLLNLTDLCNSRCVFCEIWKIKPKDEINISHLKKLLYQILIRANNTGMFFSKSLSEDLVLDLIDHARIMKKRLRRF